MEEIWKDVVEYEGLFQVSNIGRIRSIRSELPRILHQSVNAEKYHTVCLTKDGESHTYFVHRIVARAFCKGYKKGLVVNHKDENPENNNVDNLEWCTPKYNINYNDVRVKAKMRNDCIDKFNHERAEIGKLIRKRRNELGISAYDLGKASHYCDSVIYGMESGIYSPNVDRLRLMLDVLGYKLVVVEKEPPSVLSKAKKRVGKLLDRIVCKMF